MNKQFERDLTQVLLTEDDTYSTREPCFNLTKTDLEKLWLLSRATKDDIDLADIDKLWSLVEEEKR